MARPNGKDRGLFERPKGSGIWWVLWYDHRGRRHREKAGTKAAARDLYLKRKAYVLEIRKGLRPETDLIGEKQNRVTLGEYIASCLPELRQQRSWKDQERMAKIWTRLIGSFYLDEVTANHAVLRRTARLEKGIAPKTCNNETVFLGAILERAVRDGLLEKNPLKALKLLPVDNKRFRIATGSEEERLEAAMDSESFEIVAFALDTGFRRETIFTLAWPEVDLEHGWVTVIEDKSNTRQVPMTSRVRAILQRRWESRTCSWVFPNSKGKPLNADTWAARVFRPALEKAGIEGLWIHDLRRTFASKLARKGKGGRVLSGLMGHKSSKTTDRYAYLDPESFQSAIQALDEEPSRGGLRRVK